MSKTRILGDDPFAPRPGVEGEAAKQAGEPAPRRAAKKPAKAKQAPARRTAEAARKEETVETAAGAGAGVSDLAEATTEDTLIEEAAAGEGAGDEAADDASAGDEGAGDEGAGDEGAGDEGAGDEGAGDEGAGDEGAGDEGAGDEGAGDEADGDEATAGDGAGEEVAAGDEGLAEADTDADKDAVDAAIAAARAASPAPAAPSREIDAAAQDADAAARQIDAAAQDDDAAAQDVDAAAQDADAAAQDADAAAQQVGRSWIHDESAPPPPYGPSIDQPPPAGHRAGLLGEVRRIEARVRAELGPGEGERRRLPLEPLWRRWRDLAMRDRSEVVDEFGLDPRVAARLAPWFDFLYTSYFRVSARGLPHIPDAGRALIVANHSGSLPYDAAMLMHAVRKEHAAARVVRPLVEDFVFHFPYLGTLMNRIGGVRACQENAARLLDADELVAVFPEGEKGIGKLWRQRYQLQRFGRGGFVKLALSTDAPIVPAAIVGAEEIHPMLTRVTWLAKSIGIPYIPITPTFPWLGPLGLVPLPSKWFIAFGEPLYFNLEYGAGAARDRILVGKLAEQVRQRIQEMIDSLLAERGSVLFG